MTYKHHIKNKLGISLLFFYGGILTVIHAFLPFILKNASQTYTKQLEHKLNILEINYNYEANKDTSG